MMMVNGISSGSSPYVPKPAANGGSDVAQLEQQKKVLQEEVTRVKADEKLAPEAKKKQLDILQKKLQKIENAIQKASSDSKAESEINASVAKETKAEMSSSESLNDILQDPNAEDKNGRKRIHENKFDELGNLIGFYA